MTRTEFAAECAARFISPDLALECEEVVAAIRAGDIEALRDALDENF